MSQSKLPVPEISTTVVTKVNTTLTIGREALLAILRNAGYAIEDNARMYVRVPGGGDWSNMDLDIGTESDIIVESSHSKTE